VEFPTLHAVVILKTVVTLRANALLIHKTTRCNFLWSSKRQLFHCIFWCL